MMNTLGKRLIKARKEKHLTQEQLSELSGVSLSQLSRLECDKCSPTIDTLLALCSVLEISLEEILYDYLPDSIPHQNPSVKHILAMIENMDDKHCRNIEEIISIYCASHQK